MSLRRWLRRGAPLLLIAGVTLALNQLADRWPRERRLEVVLDRPETITRLDVAWTSEADPSETLQSTSWRFDEGKAPRSIVTMVHLPSGAYGVDLAIERGGEPGDGGATIEASQGGGASSSPPRSRIQKERRPVRVDGDEVRIFLRR